MSEAGFDKVIAVDLKAAALAYPQMHRAAAPEEISGMVLFLASDLSGFATGGVFTVDGGQTALTPTGPPERVIGCPSRPEGASALLPGRCRLCVLSFSGLLC
jgi:hypothetical protein